MRGPNDRLEEIRALAEQIIEVADGGLGTDLPPEEAEDVAQECYDLAVRIRDLTGGS